MKNSGVCNCNSVGITSKVFNGIAVTIEGFFDFSIPIDGIETVPEFIPLVTVTKFLTGFWEIEFVFLVVLLQIKQKLSAEFFYQRLYTDKKFIGAKL